MDIINDVKDKNINEELENNKYVDIVKMFIYSFIGVFIFFIPIKINGLTFTIINHISYKVQSEMMPFLKLCIVIYTLIGCLKPFINKDEEKNKIYEIIRFISLIIVVNILYGSKSIPFINENNLLIIEEIIMNLITLLPLTSIFMVFLIEYGLLDIIESFTHNTMKKAFKLSGKSIVNIMMYLFTDCFCGLFMTNSMYKAGRLRQSEVIIINFNFSIASFTMINYISNELDINIKGLICTSLFVLIIMNMILSRVYPFNKKKKSYLIKTTYKETTHKKDRFKKGIKKYLQNKSNKKIFNYMINNLEECFTMIINILPDLIIILFIGDMIIKSGAIIKSLQFILYPIMNLLKLSDIQVISKFVITGFFNDILAIDEVLGNISYVSRYIIAIVAVLKGISLTSNIVYMIHDTPPIKVKECIIIYIERIVLILSIYCLIYYSAVGYML